MISISRHAYILIFWGPWGRGAVWLDRPTSYKVPKRHGFRCGICLRVEGLIAYLWLLAFWSDMCAYHISYRIKQIVWFMSLRLPRQPKLTLFYVRAVRNIAEALILTEHSNGHLLHPEFTAPNLGFYIQFVTLGQWMLGYSAKMRTNLTAYLTHTYGIPFA